jgi:hypothetical protein
LKQFAAILIIGILCFNFFGYKVYYHFAMQNADETISKAINTQSFDNSETVTYKFSAKQLPYYTNSKHYEAANGEVEVNGTSMAYVKKRIYQDSIEYVCLPNHQKTQIRNARDEFFKLVNDLNNLTQNKSSKKQTNTVVKPFSFEATTLSDGKIQTNSAVKTKKEYNSFNSINLSKPYLAYNTPPPDVA